MARKWLPFELQYLWLIKHWFEKRLSQCSFMVLGKHLVDFGVAGALTCVQSCAWELLCFLQVLIVLPWLKTNDCTMVNCGLYWDFERLIAWRNLLFIRKNSNNMIVSIALDGFIFDQFTTQKCSIKPNYWSAYLIINVTCAWLVPRTFMEIKDSG